ncbi:type I-B CRISPR-associated protein Cas7/Csh2 [Clostridium sp. cel8]|jgi:CRISPR-associated protein Csh2|uniref:type I-B CRISPR-associated protein Cas7/Csh2 n=1 Tax=unclassified Clostridium TaxID=2614128 RepID=UPI0015F3B8AE|nr:type I-B CRISPR-associated protein Cas7/Csh2 [Clostridium sp. cel8]MBA5851225.1 type I-B CRISPR-associated protein Cas7/Csh2 [Clostridium sp. cel8]
MNNSEILYLYDAKLSNPNGDPDEENRPRMDYEREINLVSDIRLKRYVRNYLMDNGYKDNVFVRKLEDKSVTPEKIIGILKNNDVDTILDELIDVRLFGATIPIKKDNKTFIGPVQFNWGYSLNKVELMEASITSHFSSGERNSQGTIGKDYRVKYSFIAFSGVISGKRAEKTRLREEDVALLDEAMRYAIPELATRSKIGQYPRLYMRVEYKDSKTVLGDFRDYVKLISENESIRGINECYLDVEELIRFLNNHKNKILKIHYFKDENLRIVKGKIPVEFQEAFSDFTLEEVK